MSTLSIRSLEWLASRRRERRVKLAALLAAPGLLALVWDPARWLWRTWLDPSCASDGAVVAAITAALLAASLLSGSAPADARASRRAAGLLVLTAAIRLAGRLLAVDTIGALALGVDVGAVAMLLGVERRPFALRPAALAAFFTLSLPLEYLAQRLLGHPLQLLAARTAEVLLHPFSPEMTRQGVLLLHPAIRLSVDLPCSGARGLVLLSALFLGFWTRRALSGRGIALALASVGFGAFVANTLRIVALFAGSVAGLPVIEEPWHTALGAAALALGALPLLAVIASAPPRRPRRSLMQLPFERRGSLRRGKAATSWPAALLVGVSGLAIAVAPGRPLDVAPPARALVLPASLLGFRGSPVPLRDVERRYYQRWGGFVEKRVYTDAAGPVHTVLLVRTRAPLRHLHGPDQCLIGAGHRVTRLGVRSGPIPTVVYRSVAPDGRSWRVEASFVSDRGERATSVSEVVWRWLAAPDTTWSLVERISPWQGCEARSGRCRDFDRALFTSLDLPLEPRSSRNGPRTVPEKERRP